MWKVITFRIFDVGSKTEFTNNSLNSQKIGKLNIETLIIPQVLSIHEKTQTKKSHATVPLSMHVRLKVYFFNIYSAYTVYRYLRLRNREVHCKVVTKTIGIFLISRKGKFISLSVLFSQSLSFLRNFFSSNL